MLQKGWKRREGAIKIWVILPLCFVAFVITGFVLKAGEQIDPKYIPKSILRSVSIYKTQNAAFIQINCRSSNPIATYNLKTDKFLISPAVFAQKEATLEDFVFGIPKDYLFTIMGGPGGGVSILTIWKFTNSAPSKNSEILLNITYFLISAFGGLNVGRHIAETFEPTCGSQRFRRRLQDVNFRVEIKKEIISTMRHVQQNCGQPAAVSTDEELRRFITDEATSESPELSNDDNQTLKINDVVNSAGAGIVDRKNIDNHRLVMSDNKGGQKLFYEDGVNLSYQDFVNLLDSTSGCSNFPFSKIQSSGSSDQN